jgi:hypothetical protein
MTRIFKIPESVTVGCVLVSRNNRHPRMAWLEESLQEGGGMTATRSDTVTNGDAGL